MTSNSSQLPFVDYMLVISAHSNHLSNPLARSITDLLEENNSRLCLLLPNTTNRLQPMDLSVNRQAKDMLKRCFEDWHSQQIMKQLQEEDVDLQPVNLC